MRERDIRVEPDALLLAYCDTLTGLSNRAFFLERLRTLLSDMTAAKTAVAVIFFDLDHFKIVNDSLGHEAGDTILKVVADRMRANLRNTDIGARLGGDEFTVLIGDEATVDKARHIARHLLEATRKPIPVGNRMVAAGGSFGIALGLAGEDTAEELLRKADVAMYHAKAAGKNACSLFSPELDHAVLRQLEAATDLISGQAHRE